MANPQPLTARTTRRHHLVSVGSAESSVVPGVRSSARNSTSCDRGAGWFGFAQVYTAIQELTVAGRIK